MRRCKPIGVRFASKFAIDNQTGCWNWTGAVFPTGYGAIGRGRRGDGIEYAHRVSYALFVGPIPDGLDIDHLCRNRACVRPDHLEPVTRRENIRRGLQGVLKIHREDERAA